MADKEFKIWVTQMTRVPVYVTAQNAKFAQNKLKRFIEDGSFVEDVEVHGSKEEHVEWRDYNNVIAEEV